MNGMTNSTPFPSYCKPTRPYGVRDAINRYAAATGTPRYAAAASGANYNGHRVGVTYNDYRGYWVAEYTWAGRCVIARGDLDECIRAALAEYERGALGASVHVYPRSELDVVACQRAGLVEERAAEEDRVWFTDLHKEVPQAFSLERHGLCPAVGLLANSTTLAEYKAKVDAHLEHVRNLRRRQVGT